MWFKCKNKSSFILSHLPQMFVVTMDLSVATNKTTSLCRQKYTCMTVIMKWFYFYSPLWIYQGILYKNKPRRWTQQHLKCLSRTGCRLLLFLLLDERLWGWKCAVMQENVSAGCTCLRSGCCDLQNRVCLDRSVWAVQAQTEAGFKSLLVLKTEGRFLDIWNISDYFLRKYISFKLKSSKVVLYLKHFSAFSYFWLQGGEDGGS